MKRKIIELLIWLKDISLKTTIIVLVIALLDRPIDSYLLSPLWGFLHLEHCWQLSVLVGLLSAVIGYYGCVNLTHFCIINYQV